MTVLVYQGFAWYYIPLDPKPMKNAGSRLQNLGEITPKNDGNMGSHGMWLTFYPSESESNPFQSPSNPTNEGHVTTGVGLRCGHWCCWTQGLQSGFFEPNGTGNIWNIYRNMKGFSLSEQIIIFHGSFGRISLFQIWNKVRSQKSRNSKWGRIVICLQTTENLTVYLSNAPNLSHLGCQSC